MATPEVKVFSIENNWDLPVTTPRVKTFGFENNWDLPVITPVLKVFSVETETDVPPDLGTPETGQMFEVTQYTVGGGDTTLANPHLPNHFEVTVVSPTNFTVDSWVEVKEGQDREFAQIEAINGSVLKFYSPLVGFEFSVAATVKNVDVIQRYEGDDWTINRTTGDITLLAGKFTAGKEVFFRYSQTIADLDGYEAYRIPGTNPVAEKEHHDTVTGHGSVTTVDAAIGAGATQVQDVLPSSQGGSTHTYYLFSKDATGNVSRAQALVVEALPSVVQNLAKTVGQEKVTLTWDPVTEPNFNGVNIFRTAGAWNPANAVQVNSIPVTGTSFVDGAENVTTRRPEGEVPFPQSGATYNYVVEAEDTVTDWDTGNQNQSADPLKSEVLQATKVDD